MVWFILLIVGTHGEAMQFGQQMPEEACKATVTYIQQDAEWVRAAYCVPMYTHFTATETMEWLRTHTKNN